MNTVLRASLFMAMLSMSLSQLKAQCEVSDIVIQNISVSGTTNPATCTVKFDVSFHIEDNNGNKYIFVHAWLQQDYPNYFQCINGQSHISGTIKAPKSTDLLESFVNIGIDNSGTDPVLLTSYPADASVTLTSIDSIARQVLPDGSAAFILYGVEATVPVICGTPVVVLADLWASQSARAQNAHCVNCGIMYSAGYLSLNGLVNCATLTYNATITNNTSLVIEGFYRVYADVDGNGYFVPEADTLIQDTTQFTVMGNSTVGISGSFPLANTNQDLFILLSQTTGAAPGTSVVFLLPSTQCAPLPVSFRSFSAVRTGKNSVALRWETATEINNSGFALQRNLGNNTWLTVSFIPTRAPGGNSNSVLVYTYNDVNSHPGISQYRLRQVDLDGRFKMSEIRAVRGYGQKGETIVYPIPSPNGHVTVIFDDAEGTRDVTLFDMNGRAMRQWKSLSSNLLQVEGLRPGMYSLRIQNRETGKISVEKISIIGN